MQKQARKQGKAVIAATTHKDLKRDFAPNVHIHKRYGKEVTVQYHPKAHTAQCSLTHQMTIQQGTTADYKTLSQFHYRTSRLPPSRKIFTLKRNSELCGVIVYSSSSPMCFGRAKVWKGNIQQLNAEVSIISRVVVHPKYRSIGLGSKLVAETLNHAGTPNVETVAVMAKYNPFFERAGMQPIAESKPTAHLSHALQELDHLGFDTALMASTDYNKQKLEQTSTKPIIDVLIELSLHDGSVRRRLCNLKNVYPHHEEFAEKIAEFDIAELAVALKRLSFCAQSKVYLFWKKEDFAFKSL
jgi:GNAT superfamily N-acetyltransferase